MDIFLAGADAVIQILRTVLLSVAVVFGWAVYVILKGGSSGFSVRPFNPGESSFTGITYGIVYAAIFVSQSLPQENPIMRGFRDGGRAARDEFDSP